MNLSNACIIKLEKLKNDLYEEIIKETCNELKDEGGIVIKLSEICHKYDYYFGKDDFLKLNYQNENYQITASFEADIEFVPQNVKNQKMYNLILCKKEIKAEISKAIKKYNENNEKIRSLV